MNQVIWYSIEITIDGGRELAGSSFRFNYYREPTISDILPNSGPMRGATNVNILGKGFNQEGACNKTLRFSVFEVKPIQNTYDTSAIVLSPPANNPDAVVVGVTLNG